MRSSLLACCTTLKAAWTPLVPKPMTSNARAEGRFSILFPTGITVRGARGYDVSEALFGTYGRPTGPLGTCRSPFDQHDDVSGDLQECAQTATAKAVVKPLSARAAAAAIAVEQFARRGFCQAGAEVLPGICGVAVPVSKPVDGNRFAFTCAVSVKAGAEQRLVEDLGPRLVKMVAIIETALDARTRMLDGNPVRSIHRVRRRASGG